MDLKIDDVAKLLRVSQTTIRRWLADGKIPAYRLNHQYRFSRIEIENWMLKCKLKPIESIPAHDDSQESQAARGGMQHFSLYRAIHRGGAFNDIPGHTKEQLIRGAMPRIADRLKLDAEVLSELLIDREKLMPTALNNGIAVPHSRECLDQIPFDLVEVVFPEKPIDYGALDNKPVHTLFFLFATDDKTHLHLLAKIAHLSSNPEALKLFQTRPDKTVLMEFIKDWEANLRI